MHCAPSGTSNASTIKQAQAMLLARKRREQHFAHARLPRERVEPVRSATWSCSV
jgi:hypothetical protein